MTVFYVLIIVLLLWTWSCVDSHNSHSILRIKEHELKKYVLYYGIGAHTWIT
jgi:hypothetical protein